MVAAATDSVVDMVTDAAATVMPAALMPDAEPTAAQLAVDTRLAVTPAEHVDTLAALAARHLRHAVDMAAEPAAVSVAAAT
jgi:hypothetical protein